MIEDIEAIIEILEERVSDFPPPTCSDIDRAIRDFSDVRTKADAIIRRGVYDENFEEFVGEVDSALWGLPSDIDDIRSSNDAMRTSLHEALASRKEAVRLLGMIAKRLREDMAA